MKIPITNKKQESYRKTRQTIIVHVYFMNLRISKSGKHFFQESDFVSNLGLFDQLGPYPARKRFKDHKKSMCFVLEQQRKTSQLYAMASKGETAPSFVKDTLSLLCRFHKYLPTCWRRHRGDSIRGVYSCMSAEQYLCKLDRYFISKGYKFCSK